ncbi:hypothetical protein [Pseudoduganella sp. GCM10020061]|uniref:hypothetical protein n=1 Tax=Pseudoduganella sp. GCM10020061 TaxID=3317345 RepID=UPI003642A662
MRFLGLMLFALILGGCDKYAMVEKLAPAEVQAEAKSHIAKLRSRDFAALEAELDDSLKGKALGRKTLAQMADAIPPGEPDSVHLVQYQRRMQNGVTSDGSLFEYIIGGKSIVVTVSVDERDGVRKIVGLYVHPQQVPLEEQGGLTIEGAGALQWTVLAATVAAFLVSLVALVKCVRTKGLRRKWLWIIAILVGVGKISLNWHTGQLDVSPVAFQILSASYFFHLAGPTILAFSLPLGALVFLSRYRKNSPIHAAAASPDRA